MEFPVDLVRRMLALTQEQRAHLTQVHLAGTNLLQGILPYCDSRTKRAALLQHCRMTSRSATKELQKGWLQQ